MKSISTASDETPISIIKARRSARTFNFDLNEKKAKAKLLKGANRRNHLDIEVKSGCVNMRFSDGSYHKVLLPLVREWQNLVDEPFQLDDIEIKIEAVDAGSENSDKHMDTKLVFFANNDRLVMHAYNGTQNLMIQGKNYESFAVKYLKPLFVQKIELSKEKIESFNSGVKEVLGKDKKSIKDKTKVAKPFHCPNCKVKSATVGDLRMHMKSSHGRKQISRKPMETLDEDTSLLMLEDTDDSIVTLEENLIEKDDISVGAVPVIDCEWLPCDYKSSDKKLLIEHIDVHLGDKNRPNLPELDDIPSCNLCDFDSENQEEVDIHVKRVHNGKPPTPLKKYEQNNGDIVSKVKDVEVIEQMPCPTETEPENYKCDSCEKMFLTSLDLEWHIETEHEQSVNMIKCKVCTFQSVIEKDFYSHQQTHHMSIKVDIDIKEQSVIGCDLCNYQCRLNIEMKNHMKRKHETSLKYTCKNCDYESNYVADVWEHTVNQHPDNSPQFTPKQGENLILKIVAEQNSAIMEEMETLKKDIKGAFYELAEVLEANIVNLKDDTNQKCKTLGDTVVKLYNKICKPGKPSEVNIQQKKQKKKSSILKKPEPTSIPSSKATPAKSPCEPKPKSTPAPSKPSIEPSMKPKSLFLSKPKVLYVGDSVGHTANMKILEKDNNCRLRTARAYSSVYDDAARWPEYNFTDIVNYNLGNPGREEYEMLVMSAPTVDITNLDTTGLAPSGNTEYYKQEVIMSCQNMFNLAQASLNKHPNLSKVVIMEHTPRFDQPHVDPTSLKSKLARLANATLSQLLVISPLKDKIIIGRHSLMTSGDNDAHFTRYQNYKTGRYDGVHLYGNTGCTDYTASVKQILMLALPEDHTNCMQAKYQSRHQSNGWSYQKRTRYQKDGNKGYNKTRVGFGNPGTGFTMPTQNRFNLFDNFQGNF